ncbi:MAG: hypothetical protein J3K34DRAFT_523229 [Monoraphidium minutum]|nr:MAG: hypothetical protein J3K34DRAFT_523229 [Monoraphidium minutum]
MAMLAWHPGRNLPRPGPSSDRARSLRPRALVRTRVLLEDPYRTLGVSSDADEREIKAAYRRLARKYHPDVNSACDAEHRFVHITAAYEVLIGKRAAPSRGAVTTNQANGWEFQDWFWSFSASRRWAAQHHARPPHDAPRAPQDAAALHSQLAGLRQRAAIRHTQQSRGGRAAAEAAEGAAAPAHAAAAGAQQQQHHQPGGEQPPLHHHQQQQQRHSAHEQQQAPPPPPPVVEYDSTSMSDGVNMAAGVGYDPWSPDLAAAAGRGRFTATETHKHRVVGQLGGLKRRAAVKRRADAAQTAAARAGGGGAAPGGEDSFEDCTWV